MNSLTTAIDFAKQSTWRDQDQPAFSVLRAAHLGMCFGVRDAISLALRQSASGPLTILGDLVHNPAVLQDLRERGVQIQKELESVQTPRLMITAHGASDRAKSAARERGFELSEATCPLVHFAHRSVASLVAEGFHPVVIGQRDHVEVRGLTGDLDSFDVILSEEDVERLPRRERFGVAAQTTQPIARVRRLVELLRTRFPDAEVRFIDTVCQPTKQRQNAAVELARRSDVVVVIGGLHSNNTRELVQTCRQHCSRVHHVQSASDLQPAWFHEAKVVGLTAGTSTPDSAIDDVERVLLRLAEGLKADSHARRI